MTLFTLLLVLMGERLFKMGEHWQLDHRLEVLFGRVKHFSLLRTLLMTAAFMAVVFLITRALHGLLFNVPLLVFWIALGVLCIGAGQVRLHYHSYLKAASHDDVHARDAMASELTLIHGVPPECSEREYLRELQNALLCIRRQLQKVLRRQLPLKKVTLHLHQKSCEMPVSFFRFVAMTVRCSLRCAPPQSCLKSVAGQFQEVQEMKA